VAEGTVDQVQHRTDRRQHFDVIWFALRIKKALGKKCMEGDVTIIIGSNWFMFYVFVDSLHIVVVWKICFIASPGEEHCSQQVTLFQM
jgi:hypothetical protein